MAPAARRKPFGVLSGEIDRQSPTTFVPKTDRSGRSPKTSLSFK